MAGGLIAGVAFLVATHALLRRHDVHVGKLRGADVRTSVLVFVVLFAHSLPEGLAVGTAYASDTDGAGSLRDRGDRAPEHPRGHERGDPDGGGRIQPHAAVLGRRGRPARRNRWAPRSLTRWSRRSRSLLPVSFAFAAGAMLALVVWDLLPRTLSPRGWSGPLGFAGGGLLMLALSAVLGVS